jgi:hypothetical protein
MAYSFLLFQLFLRWLQFTLSPLLVLGTPPPPLGSTGEERYVRPEVTYASLTRNSQSHI